MNEISVKHLEFNSKNVYYAGWESGKALQRVLSINLLVFFSAMLLNVQSILFFAPTYNFQMQCIWYIFQDLPECLWPAIQCQTTRCAEQGCAPHPVLRGNRLPRPTPLRKNWQNLRGWEGIKKKHFFWEIFPKCVYPPKCFCEIWENKRWNLGRKRRSV